MRRSGMCETHVVNLILRCLCDEGWDGHACSLRMCPLGDDPGTTGQADEVQVIDCRCDTTCTGNIVLSFRNRHSSVISASASSSAVQTAIESIIGVRSVTVSMTGGSALCGNSAAVSTAITFTHNPGDHPTMVISSNSLASSSGTAPTISVISGGSTSANSVASVDGTRERIECSGRGTCDRATGMCSCKTGYSSSNGAGAQGNTGDCSALTTPMTYSFIDASLFMPCTHLYEHHPHPRLIDAFV